MARLADPRNSAGAREVWRSQTRMSGALSLWLLSLLREQRESNSPRGEIDSERDRGAAVNCGLSPIVTIVTLSGMSY